MDDVLRWFGYEIRRTGRRPAEIWQTRPGGSPQPPLPYAENPAIGASNLRVKLERVRAGGAFETENIAIINQAVARLIGPATRIVELGGGTGMFAYEASADPTRTIVCSEFDAEASRWAQENRSRPNIRYVTRPVSPQDGPFDLLVSIEVVEHVRDFPAFLAVCAGLAPRAILTTPNKSSRATAAADGPPDYRLHVREWTAGEFYWVLRCFYEEVRLFTLPDALVPDVAPIRVTDRRSPLIADCRRPIAASGGARPSA
ncbi:MAG: methyltransferase domain-containing protein [Candidatus Rokubacteria bacterium]|nr:methyltransferase domain-containing protein [Candidatus Rokubacteria bacterium]